MNVVWTEGSANLYDYPAENPEDAPIVLFIPSLINRSYILDLSEKRSFLKYLQRMNIHSYLIDWGEPTEEEMNFCLDDYIADRLDKIINYITEKTPKKIFLAGYCMGGLMAIASVLRNQDKIKGLALFATPWDFHVKEFAKFKLNEEALGILYSLLDSSDKIPAHIIQSMFYYLHPDLIQQKFDSLFSSLDNSNKEREEFLAIEHWLNDGISMTKRVGKECFIDWVHYNKVALNKWSVEGQIIDPRKIDIPTFFCIAEKDHIAPKESILPLTEFIANKKIVIANTGHISMMAGSRAEQVAWEPFRNWVIGTVL